jgi:hypothetical protein
MTDVQYIDVVEPDQEPLTGFHPLADKFPLMTSEHVARPVWSVKTH